MKIIGALSQPQTKTIVYFCTIKKAEVRALASSLDLSSVTLTECCYAAVSTDKIFDNADVKEKQLMQGTLVGIICESAILAENEDIECCLYSLFDSINEAN